MPTRLLVERAVYDRVVDGVLDRASAVTKFGVRAGGEHPGGSVVAGGGLRVGAYRFEMVGDALGEIAAEAMGPSTLVIGPGVVRIDL